jgi:SAM-dependent methyltransferase
MTEPTLQAQIDGARAYEALMVPALFGEWAPKVTDAAQIQAGERVLDVACGTGILAREAASRVGGFGSVAGLDRSAGMLEAAKQLAPRVEWRQGVAESLPFADQAFDAVVSQFGLMFFDDRREALRQVLRVLRPGGRLPIAVWDSLDSIPAYADEVALLERLAGTPAAEALRAPFVLGNRRDLTTLFADAGVPTVEVTTLKGAARFPTVRVMVEADLRGWLPLMGVVLTEEQIAGILEAAEQALSRYVTSDGTVSFETSAHLVTGAKP